MIGRILGVLRFYKDEVQLLQIIHTILVVSEREICKMESMGG